MSAGCCLAADERASPGDYSERSRREVIQERESLGSEELAHRWPRRFHLLLKNSGHMVEKTIVVLKGTHTLHL
jgi:hypothetical protein